VHGEVVSSVHQSGRAREHELPRPGVPPFAWLDREDEERHDLESEAHAESKHVLARRADRQGKNSGNTHDGEDRHVDVATLAKHVKEMRKYFKAYGIENSSRHAALNLICILHLRRELFRDLVLYVGSRFVQSLGLQIVLLHAVKSESKRRQAAACLLQRSYR